MNKLASNPIILMALGLILGVGTGVGCFWKSAAPLVARARQLRMTTVPAGKPDAPWDFWTIEIEGLENDLKDTKISLKKREEELVARETRLTAERAEMLKQRQELETLRSEIGSRMIEVGTDEAKNIKSLSLMYSNLTPKATLSIFKEMDDVTVVKLLSQMKADVVSPLFEELGRQAATDPALGRRAAALSEKLRLVKSTKTAASP